MQIDLKLICKRRVAYPIKMGLIPVSVISSVFKDRHVRHVLVLLTEECLCVIDYYEWTKERDARKFQTQAPDFALTLKVRVAVIRTSGENVNEYKPLFEIFNLEVNT